MTSEGTSTIVTDAPATNGITTVIFDYGEVLSRPQSHSARTHMERIGGVPAQDFWEAYWSGRRAYDLGQDGGAYWRGVADRLGVGWDARQLQELWSADVASWLDFESESIALVRTLMGNGLTLALLSNAPRAIGAVLRHSPALAGFDAVYFSGELGLAKPDAEIYTRVLSDLGCPAEQALFVDDREENIRAAASLGLHTHRFTGVAPLAEVLASHALV